MSESRQQQTKVTIDDEVLSTARSSLRLSFADILKRPWKLIKQRKMRKRLACGATKYGCDPRIGAEDHTAVLAATVQTKALPLAEPGVVGQLQEGTAHLSLLLEDAAASGRAVILKFKRDGCPACKSTIAPLDSAAKAYMGKADFLTVDYNELKLFCKHSRIYVVPCAHIYVDGQLADAVPLGPSKWGDFKSRLEELIGQPDGEVLDAEIPNPKAADLDDALRTSGLDTWF
eukprot:CAMPEP_0115857816 /NCGR_PEP_ID=MMETSP0287-20121206/15773_1 /TAXON_ID=412157 /ORGANISM="Chrysochromulina rotalis, Strain UIO044" /LENGTH=230 /DNA_ID=CAMNT_0003312053 /DNA_START=48 /DNA_END=740 /DNA_ORIENTATION=+